MISVRFGKDAAAAVQRFARQDRMTVSQWIRHLVDHEINSPNRYPAVDFRLYPATQTVSSGGATVIEMVKR
jgi:hypothetical protein